MKEFIVTVNGKSYEVQVEELGGIASASPKVAPIPNAPAARKPAVGTAGKTPIKCPMPGTIMDIKVKAGDAVKSGAVLCILEAMKMENEIKAPADGVVASINVAKGASVNSNDVLMTIN
jgi:biotin carboxyl carrier protein